METPVLSAGGVAPDSGMPNPVRSTCSRPTHPLSAPACSLLRGDGPKGSPGLERAQKGSCVAARQGLSPGGHRAMHRTSPCPDYSKVISIASDTSEPAPVDPSARPRRLPQRPIRLRLAGSGLEPTLEALVLPRGPGMTET